MRVPAVALAAAFACGAALGGSRWLVGYATSRPWLLVGFAAALLLIAGGLVWARAGHRLPAASASLSSWLMLGVLGAGIASQPRPANHVLSFLASRRLELNSPLRWHGVLRDEPARLAWGHRYELELKEVEYQGALLPLQGGLRINFSENPARDALPDVHAGDRIAVTTQAKLPQVYRDEGAFDRRAYLSEQNVHLVATLRASGLMEREAASPTTAGHLLARLRRSLRVELDTLFATTPQVGAVLRAMLLGDRSFVERAEATDFQKTGVFHVLVVAGLHVGALAAFVFWAGRFFRLRPIWIALLALAVLFAYVAVVEQRPPVLRAGLMATIAVLGGVFFRRLDLLNSAASAALLLLIAKPFAVRDSSFQLTFLAIGCIVGLAVPWLDKSAQPYVKALRGWREISRDAAHEPRAAQFRIDLRAFTRWISGRLPSRLGPAAGTTIASGIKFSMRVWELFVVTVVLQLGMLPLLARDFHRVSLTAPFVNLGAVFLTGIVVPLGFVTLGSGLLWSGLGKLMALPLAWTTLLLLRVVRWFAVLPYGSYRIPGPPPWLLLVFLVTAAALAILARVNFFRRRLAIRGASTVLLLSGLSIAVFPFAPLRSAGKLEMTVLDVGQGDSILLVSPHGKTMLIDGGGSFGGFSGQEEHYGPDPGEDAVSPYLWSRGFQKLDVVALTHAHQDHIGGLTAILENFRVGQLWVSSEVNSAALANLEDLARRRNVTIVHQRRGAFFLWDGVATQFLWPVALAEVAEQGPKNNDSLVLHMKFGERALLLPGDAERQAETAMLTESAELSLQADVLKVGHHGSKNSTTPDFLSAVRPRFAVISAGEDNPYGHPSPELLERLATAGVQILRTDRDGAVHIATDGRQLDVSCFVICPQFGADAVFSSGSQPPNQQQQGQQ